MACILNIFYSYIQVIDAQLMVTADLTENVEDSAKSAISIIYEIAFRRRLKVEFEVPLYFSNFHEYKTLVNNLSGK